MKKFLLLSVLFLLTACSNKPSQQEEVKLSDIFKNEETFVFTVDITDMKNDEKYEGKDSLYIDAPIMNFHHLRNNKITSYNVPRESQENVSDSTVYNTRYVTDFSFKDEENIKYILDVAKSLDKQYHDSEEVNFLYEAEDELYSGDPDLPGKVLKFEYKKPKTYDVELELIPKDIKDAEKLKKTSDTNLIFAERMKTIQRYYDISSDSVSYDTSEDYMLMFDKKNKPKLIKAENDKYFLVFHDFDSNYADLLPVSKKFKKLLFDKPSDYKGVKVFSY